MSAQDYSEKMAIKAAKPRMGLFPFDVLRSHVNDADRARDLECVIAVQDAFIGRPLVNAADLPPYFQGILDAWYSPTDLARIIPVLEFGAKKYAPHGWESGFAHSQAYDAFCRHWFAIFTGEIADPETGLPHEDHALCELVFLTRFQERGIGLADYPGNACAQTANDNAVPVRDTLATPPPAPRSTVPPGDEFLWAYGGKHLPLVPQKLADLPSVKQIAKALEGLHRFTGHAGTVTVAGHCVRVSLLLQHFGASPSLQMSGLFHDAHEVLYGDISSPLKSVLRRTGDLAGYDRLCERFDEMLSARESVGLGPTLDDADADLLKRADWIAFQYEARHYLNVPVGELASYADGIEYGFDSTTECLAPPLPSFVDRYAELRSQL